MLLAAVLGTQACGGDDSSPVPVVVLDGSSSDRDAQFAVDDAESMAADGDASDAAAAVAESGMETRRDAGMPPLDNGAPFYELPRLVADPTLTRRLLTGVMSFVGDGLSSCSHGSLAERWCAFSRPAEEAGATTELWVFNVSKAIAGGEVSCDRDGADCIRLTSNLFTGTQPWGVYYPLDVRFDGDTLIFYADAAADTPAPYVGPVFAWRPGWTKARQLTSNQGGLCFGHHRAAVAYCTDSVVSPKIAGEVVPNVREMDLLAGRLDEFSVEPLPKAVHLVADGPKSVEGRARFTAQGEDFVFSFFSQADNAESVNAVKTAEVGLTAPSQVLADGAQWEIAHDARKIYYLQGHDRLVDPVVPGTLMMADYPSGQSPVALRPEVASFALLGARDEVFSDVDKGISFYTNFADRSWTFSVMRNGGAPMDVHPIGLQPYEPLVATDVQHVVYLQRETSAVFKIAYVARTDGSGACMLTNDRKAESYGTKFSDSGRRVFWIEHDRKQSGSEEGWYARPDDCAQKTKYGDYVADYRLVGDDFVVFIGGDVTHRKNWLQYAPLTDNGSVDGPAPTIITENPASVSQTGAGDSTYVLYTLPSDAGGGLYAFGPLPRAATP